MDKNLNNNINMKDEFHNDHCGNPNNANSIPRSLPDETNTKSI